MYMCVHMKHIKVYNPCLYCQAGAHVDGIGKDTPLMIAATNGSTDILKCLVLAGEDANVTDNVSFSPLLLHG